MAWLGPNVKGKVASKAHGILLRSMAGGRSTRWELVATLFWQLVWLGV